MEQTHPLWHCNFCLRQLAKPIAFPTCSLAYNAQVTNSGIVFETFWTPALKSNQVSVRDTQGEAEVSERKFPNQAVPWITLILKFMHPESISAKAHPFLPTVKRLNDSVLQQNNQPLIGRATWLGLLLWECLGLVGLEL